MNLSDKIKLFNGVGSWRTYTANGEIPQIFMSDGPHGLRKQDVEDYADMSNDKAGEKPARRKPKVSCSTFIGAG